MAYITPDRVLEGSTTTGAGNITLAGNVIGFRAFSAVSSIGDLLPYFVEAVDTVGVPSGEFEVGLGRYIAANTLERVTVYASSSAGALVNFAAGQKIVGIGVPGWDAMTRSSRVGEVVFVAANVPKAGTLELNNATISRAAYPNLWAYAQTSGLLAVDATDKTANPAKFGRGDGSTTFQLPDLRDRALIARGVTFPFGSTGGNKDAIVVAHSHGASITGDGAHTHTVPAGAEASGSSSPNFRRTDNNNSTLDISGGGHTHGVTISSTGASGTNANMQPYAALLACIYF